MAKKYFRGFTLTELLIVISIVVFLVVLAMVYLRTQVFKGNDARRKADVKKIQIAAEEYEKDNDCYPKNISCKPGTALNPYISKIPCDPITQASYFLDFEDSVCPSWYRIYSILENDQDSDVTAGIGPFGAYNYYASSPNAPVPAGAEGGGGSTPPPGGGDGGGDGAGESTGFYGCKSAVCIPISWDSSRPGPECDPNYQNSTCYGPCSPEMECIPWH